MTRMACNNSRWKAAKPVKRLRDKKKMGDFISPSVKLVSAVLVLKIYNNVVG
jgi:hypothetical protein